MLSAHGVVPTELGRIALLIEPDGPGGAESTILGLANGLAARGVDVRTAVMSGGEGWLSSQLRAAGHNVFLPRLSRPIDPCLVAQLVRWVRREELRLLHAHEFTMGFYAGAAAMLCAVPHVITMHGGTSFSSVARRRLALAISARRASCVVGVSESTCAHLETSLSMSPSTVEYVPNGVKPVPGDRASTRALLGLADTDRLLLAVGNLYAVKDHAVLVDAARYLLLQTDLPAWRIAIAGRGDQERPLREQIAQAGLEHRVHLLGLRTDIPDLLAAADAWVMPSRSEGLPLALLEAMLAGLPVIASAVGGIPDVVHAGVTGMLVPPRDSRALAAAISNVLRTPAEVKQIAERGRQFVDQRFSYSSMVERYLSIYQRALHRR